MRRPYHVGVVIALLFSLTCRVAAEEPAIPEPPADPLAPYRYVGGWRGHKPGGGIGVGTVVLISPSFALTARHLAGAKAGDPSRRVSVRFGEHHAAVVEAVIAPKGDLALLRLDPPITEVEPVSLLAAPIHERYGRVEFTVVGHAGGLHAHPDRFAFADGGIDIWHEPGETGLPGRPGDSGGAWVLTPPREDADDPPPPHILIGVIRGSGRYRGQPVGRATQPAVLRAWIDAAMEPTGETARWERFPKWAPRAPRRD